MSDERMNSVTESNYSFTPELSYFGNKIRVKFDGKIVNIYIFYEISKNCNISSSPALENCLFGKVSLTKNNDIDKYKYSGYGIGFDRKEKTV